MGRGEQEERVGWDEINVDVDGDNLDDVGLSGAEYCWPRGTSVRNVSPPHSLLIRSVAPPVPLPSMKY